MLSLLDYANINEVVRQFQLRDATQLQKPLHLIQPNSNLIIGSLHHGSSLPTSARVAHNGVKDSQSVHASAPLSARPGSQSLEISGHAGMVSYHIGTIVRQVWAIILLNKWGKASMGSYHT